jgi:hypothetical protein
VPECVAPPSPGGSIRPWRASALLVTALAAFAALFWALTPRSTEVAQAAHRQPGILESGDIRAPFQATSSIPTQLDRAAVNHGETPTAMPTTNGGTLPLIEPDAPMFGNVPFAHWRARRISQLLEDRDLNPNQKKLSRQQMMELTDFRNTVNEKLGELSSLMYDASNAWAESMIDVGRYQEFAIGERMPCPPEGAIALTITKGGSLPRLVIIIPGECAELDSIALEAAQTVGNFHSIVKEKLASVY